APQANAAAPAEKPATQTQTKPQASKPATETQAPAAPAATAPLPPLAKQLGQTLQSLVGTGTQQPDAAAPAAPATAPAEGEDFSAHLSDTFSTGALQLIDKTGKAIQASGKKFKTRIAFMPKLNDWIATQGRDTRRAAMWVSLRDDLMVVILPPLLISLAVMLFLVPLRNRIKHDTPSTLLRRIALLSGLLLLRLLPSVVFLGTSVALLEQNEDRNLQRYILLNLIYALFLGFAAQQILRSIFSPVVKQLRTLPLTTPEAIAGYKWLSFFSIVIIYTYFFGNVATAVRMPAAALAGIESLIAIVLTLTAIVAVFRARRVVATMLRGNATSEDEPRSFFKPIRMWLARHWHSLGTTYLVVAFFVTVLGIEDGVSVMLRGTVLSLVVLAAARGSLVLIEKWKTPKPGESEMAHRQFLSFLLRTCVWPAAALGIGASWGLDAGSLFATPVGKWFTNAVMSIGITLLTLTVLYEMIHRSIERHLNERDKETKMPMASARAQTLLPMVRTSVFIFFTAIAFVMSLSAIGINVAPLLAGAGVLGVAIGFGSQSLVKDFLTGLFIVAENTIAVGDVVKIDDHAGLVEALSIRTIRLRDLEGCVHILPFSEVLKITNMTRGFSYALIDIGVSYDSDLERVMKVMKEVGAEVQEDPVFKRVILEPLEVLGVEELGASSITLRARIRTRAGKQWDVKRLLMLRLKQRFDAEHIEIPFPIVTYIQKK
ncbi:MAG: mechanosensitive ion channel, partial [Alphaproteobacteria bacterium]|nr:mechanosensitive ion channel [Alphaproteobacteria bacterium]